MLKNKMLLNLCWLSCFLACGRGPLPKNNENSAAASSALKDLPEYDEKVRVLSSAFSKSKSLQPKDLQDPAASALKFDRIWNCESRSAEFGSKLEKKYQIKFVMEQVVDEKLPAYVRLAERARKNEKHYLKLNPLNDGKYAAVFYSYILDDYGFYPSCYEEVNVVIRGDEQGRLLIEKGRKLHGASCFYRDEYALSVSMLNDRVDDYSVCKST